MSTFIIWPVRQVDGGRFVRVPSPSGERHREVRTSPMSRKQLYASARATAREEGRIVELRFDWKNLPPSVIYVPPSYRIGQP